MGRKKTKCSESFGKWQYSQLPVLSVTSNPKGPENAINLDKVQISQGFCHEDFKNEAERALHNNGFKNVKFLEQNQMITAKCPKCKETGKAIFSLDHRKRSKKWVDRATPIQLHYYHGKDRHYVGTWKNGQIYLSPNKESFESLLMNF